MDFKEFVIKEEIKKKYVLDASVIIKWYYVENESELEIARFFYNKVFNNEILIAAPDLMVYEVLNFFIFKLEIPSEKVSKILSELNEILFIINTDESIQMKAFKISRKIKKSLYDSLYISLSELLQCPLITADFKLSMDAKTGGYDVLLLSEFRSLF